MRILGIDPSLSSTGWAIIENGKVIKSGTIKTSAKDGDFIKRLDKIWLAFNFLLTELCHGKCFNFFAIEDVFINRRNLQVPIQLAKVHGALITTILLKANEAETIAKRIKIYAPRFVKQVITGNGNASKEQVIKMVHLQAGYKGTQLDESDAIAVALTCEREQTNGLIRRG